METSKSTLWGATNIAALTKKFHIMEQPPKTYSQFIGKIGSIPSGFDDSMRTSPKEKVH
jgi:hypothetical protein